KSPQPPESNSLHPMSEMRSEPAPLVSVSSSPRRWIRARRRCSSGSGGRPPTTGAPACSPRLGFDSSMLRKPPSSGGGALERLHRIDASEIDPPLRNTRIRLACDVTAPLLGPTGASAVFGPQKGAAPPDVARL